MDGISYAEAVQAAELEAEVQPADGPVEYFTDGGHRWVGVMDALAVRYDRSANELKLVQVCVTEADFASVKGTSATPGDPPVEVRQQLDQAIDSARSALGI